MGKHLVRICVVLVLTGLLLLSTMSLAGVGEWMEKTKMPTPRRSTAAVAVDGKIYVVGGASGAWQALSTMEVYDPETDTWTKKANMPSPRFRLSACAVNGKIYAIGGTTSDVAGGASARVEEYDPATDKWTKKADMLTARHSLCASAVNGKIYAMGGGDGSVLDLPNGLDNVEEYDPATDKWVKKADIITPRYGHASGVVGGKIYIVGGRMGKQKPGAGADTVEEYDPTTNKWKEKGDAPGIRVFHTLSVISRKIYVVGGFGDIGGFVVLSSMDQYNPATGLWTKMANMPSEKSGASSGVAQGKIYVFGGWPGLLAGVGGAVYPAVDEYTPEGWSVSPQSKLMSTWGMIKALQY